MLMSLPSHDALTVFARERVYITRWHLATAIRLGRASPCATCCLSTRAQATGFAARIIRLRNIRHDYHDDDALGGTQLIIAGEPAGRLFAGEPGSVTTMAVIVRARLSDGRAKSARTLMQAG